jgi:hypothetical protein
MFFSLSKAINLSESVFFVFKVEVEGIEQIEEIHHAQLEVSLDRRAIFDDNGKTDTAKCNLFDCLRYILQIDYPNMLRKCRFLRCIRNVFFEQVVFIYRKLT